jgi:hypothetical protein
VLHFYRAFVCLLITTVITGCGGSGSNASIHKLARRRTPDEDIEPAPKTPPAEAKSAPADSKTNKASPGPASADKKGPSTAAPSPPPPPPAPTVEVSKPPLSPPTGRGPIRLVVQSEKPKEALSPGDRRARSLANLEKIGRALTAFVEKHGRLPPQALRDPSGKQSLSWRVAILPELGYPELYDQFDSGEPWTGSRNKELMLQIPPEFQSPERFDTATNYLAVAAPGMAMEPTEGLAMEAVKDGLDNTVAILEVDDGRAVPWTMPKDWIPDLE